MKRYLVTTLAAAAFLAVRADAGHAQSKQVILFNWSNYISPDLLKRFTDETGIKVTLDTYDTNETMLAKLEAGSTGYDVVVPSGHIVQTMVREGLVQKIDVGKMPNFKNVKAPFDKPESDPERAYTAPYMWGITGIAYDTAKAGGAKLENSWKELFEPRPQFARQIGMLKDEGEVVSAAAFYLGLPQCTTDPKDAQKILDLLEKQKPDVKVYNAEGTVDRVASGEVLMQQMWNGSYHRAHNKLQRVAYVFPKEGMRLWADNFAVPKGAKNAENAKTFVNWLMDPKNAAEASNFTGYNNAIAGAEQYLTDSLRDDPAVNIPENTMALLKPTLACSKEALDLRSRIWTRLFR